MTEPKGEVVLMGGGGHAAVCADVLVSCGWDVLGFYGPEQDDEEATGLAHLGSDDDLLAWDGDTRPDLFVAIGSNSLRRRLTLTATESGWTVVTAVSPRALVSPSATVGIGALVMPGAILNAFSWVGAGAIVNTGAVVEHHVRVGTMAHVAPNVTLTGRVVVGDSVFVGAGATIIPGVRVGHSCTVGAGAVVISDVAPGTTVVGVPARPTTY